MSNDTDPARGEQWGQGGRYEIRDGARVRVEEPTVFPPPAAKAPGADGPEAAEAAAGAAHSPENGE